MGGVILTKHEVVMHQGSAAGWYFRSEVADDGASSSLMLDQDTWKDMGSPTSVLVTVVPEGAIG